MTMTNISRDIFLDISIQIILIFVTYIRTK